MTAKQFIDESKREGQFMSYLLLPFERLGGFCKDINSQSILYPALVKKNQISLMYKEIQMGLIAKS